IPRRVGLIGHSRRWLLNHQHRQGVRRGIGHQTYRYLELASIVGAKIQPQFPAANSINGRRDQLKFALCPGAEYGPAKRWPHFAEVAQEIASRFPVQWILLGTAGDAEIGAKIADVLGESCVTRIAKPTLVELLDEMSTCGRQLN